MIAVLFLFLVGVQKIGWPGFFVKGEVCARSVTFCPVKR
jgi:hypothetical protein